MLAIKSEVYKKLLEAKMENESFSDLLDRLLKHKDNITNFAGVWKDDSNVNELKDDIMRIRKNLTARGV